jgi:hypothetical protein
MPDRLTRLSPQMRIFLAVAGIVGVAVIALAVAGVFGGDSDESWLRQYYDSQVLSDDYESVDAWYEYAKDQPYSDMFGRETDEAEQVQSECSGAVKRELVLAGVYEVSCKD